METRNFAGPDFGSGLKTSRLPAGSTLQMPSGVHIPHPEAEANLPGAGDPRLGDTKAVTEYVSGPRSGEPLQIFAGLQSKPLADEVKPYVVSVAPSGNRTPSDADKTLIVDDPDISKSVS